MDSKSEGRVTEDRRPDLSSEQRDLISRMTASAP